MDVFTVDVSFSTHDMLKDGVTCFSTSRVRVLAVSGDDASLIACQMVAARGWMPTASTVCV